MVDSNRSGEDTSRHTLGLILLALLLVVIGTVLFFQYKFVRLEKQALLAISLQHENLVAEELSLRQHNLGIYYKEIIEDCTIRPEYENYINTDTRSMNRSDLEEALALHKRCGKYFFNRNHVALDFFDQEVQSFTELAAILFSTPAWPQVEELVAVWGDIYSFERERNDTLGQNMDLQRMYWEAELDKVRKIDTEGEREKRVGELNETAIQNNDRLLEIVSILAELRSKETSLWNEFYEGNIK